MAGASDTPSDGQQSKPAGISTKLKSLISRKIKGTVSLESQSGQLISPDGTRINIESLPETISVHVTESTSGNTTFDHTIGTQKSAKGQLFIAFTDIQELNPAGRWILGRIIIPITARARAAKSKYTDNWHNFTLLKVLNGSDDWKSLKNTNRCINLQLGANWCVVEFTVAIEDLDVTVTTQGDQEPVPISSSPPRQAQEQEEQESEESQHTVDPSHPSPPETAPTDHENLDDIPLADMFGSVTDKDAAISANTSISLSQSELENIGNITTDLAPPPSQGPGEAQAGVSTWPDEHSQLSQISTPAPKTNTIDQLDDTALSTVSSFSNLSNHASVSNSWINSTDLSPFTKEKFQGMGMAWAVCSCIINLIEIIWCLLHTIMTSVYSLTQWTLSRRLPLIVSATRTGWISTRALISKCSLQARHILAKILLSTMKYVYRDSDFRTTTDNNLTDTELAPSETKKANQTKVLAGVQTTQDITTGMNVEDSELANEDTKVTEVESSSEGENFPTASYIGGLGSMGNRPQPMGSAGIHQLGYKHLEDQRATQTAWVVARTRQTGMNTMGSLPTFPPNIHSELTSAARRGPVMEAGWQARAGVESKKKTETETSEPLSQQFVLVTVQQEDKSSLDSFPATKFASGTDSITSIHPEQDSEEALAKIQNPVTQVQNKIIPIPPNMPKAKENDNTPNGGKLPEKEATSTTEDAPSAEPADEDRPRTTMASPSIPPPDGQQLT